MADRLKYFLLGVLFLVVAGVIAYDRWNSDAEPPQVAEGPEGDTAGDFELSVQSQPPKADQGIQGKTPEDPQTQSQPQSQAVPAVPPSDEQRPAAPAPAADRPTTPPQVEPKAKPATPPAPDRTHVIRKGETLEAIAIKYYGTRDGIQWIAKANNLGNTNRIFANQKLVIPAKKETSKAAGAEVIVVDKAPGKIPSRYRVKEGDGNLYAICRRLYGREGQGARVSRIMEMNHLWSADVKVGTVLILPPR